MEQTEKQQDEKKKQTNIPNVNAKPAPDVADVSSTPERLVYNPSQRS